LREASLLGADLAEAYLRKTDLSRANLSGADLSFANLEGAKLEGALYSIETIWPIGFDSKEAGAILVDYKGNPIENSDEEE
jgi:uncharacterized protein YjbI with pentapeptide repeats